MELTERFRQPRRFPEAGLDQIKIIAPDVQSGMAQFGASLVICTS